MTYVADRAVQIGHVHCAYPISSGRLPSNATRSVSRSPRTADRSACRRPSWPPVTTTITSA